MKTFKYDFTYKTKSYRGILESTSDLDTYFGKNERTLMMLLADKYNFGPDFTNSRRSKYNIMVFRVGEQRNSMSSAPKAVNEVRQKPTTNHNTSTRSTNSHSSSYSTDYDQSESRFNRCDHCGKQYVISDGYYSYLRSKNKSSNFQKFRFCTTQCVKDKISNGWVKVNEYGLTKEEGEQPASSEQIHELQCLYNKYLVSKSREEAEKELQFYIRTNNINQANHIESLLNKEYPNRLKDIERLGLKAKANDLKSEGKNIKAFFLNLWYDLLDGWNKPISIKKR